MFLSQIEERGDCGMVRKAKFERSGTRRKHHVTLQLSESGEIYTTLRGAGIRDFIIREVVDVHLLVLLRKGIIFSLIQHHTAVFRNKRISQPGLQPTLERELLQQKQLA